MGHEAHLADVAPRLLKQANAMLEWQLAEHARCAAWNRRQGFAKLPRDFLVLASSRCGATEAMKLRESTVHKQANPGSQANKVRPIRDGLVVRGVRDESPSNARGVRDYNKAGATCFTTAPSLMDCGKEPCRYALADPDVENPGKSDERAIQIKILANPGGGGPKVRRRRAFPIGPASRFA